MKFDKLIDIYSVEHVEKALIHKFIQSHHLDISISPYLNSYLDGFNIDDSLENLLKTICYQSIKELENHLEILIPSIDRKLNGAFFTPNVIVEFILEEIQPSIEETILDPSCGCGAFLVYSAEYLNSKFGKSYKSIISENLFGQDILPYNIRRCKVLLSLVALLNGESIKEDDFNLVTGDSLFSPKEKMYDIVIGNPPYVKYQDLDIEYRDFLNKKFETTALGNFNLYFAFFEHYSKALSKKGRLSFITPNNYFTSLSAKSLRLFLKNGKKICKIIDFRDRRVFDAQTYTSITFMSAKPSDEFLYSRFDDQSISIDTFLGDLTFSTNKWVDLDDKKWRLLMGGERETIKRIENIGIPLGSLYKIAAGIATLKDKLYIIEDDGHNKPLIEIEDALGFKHLIEREVTKELYKISNLKDNGDVVNNNLRVIYPYHDDEKGSTVIDDTTFQSQYPLCYKYLSCYKEDLSSRDKGKKQLGPFYRYGRSQGLGRYGLQIVNPTFSKTPRFLLADNNNSLYVNGYGFYPRESAALKFNKAMNALILHPDIVVKILNSTIMDYYIHRTSVKIQGNYPCYQKNFIEKFCIPELSHMDIISLKSMSNLNDIDEFLIQKYQVNIPVPNLCS